jgi:hypothetical protein
MQIIYFLKNIVKLFCEFVSDVFTGRYNGANVWLILFVLQTGCSFCGVGAE